MSSDKQRFIMGHYKQIMQDRTSVDYHIITSDGIRFGVHKSYIAGWSNYFNTLLTGSLERSKNEICLSKVSSIGLGPVLDFYYGRCEKVWDHQGWKCANHINMDIVENVLQVATYLQVADNVKIGNWNSQEYSILERLDYFLCTEMNINNIGFILRMAERYNRLYLGLFAKKKLYKYIADIINKSENLPFSEGTFRSLVISIPVSAMMSLFSLSKIQRLNPYKLLRVILVFLEPWSESNEDELANYFLSKINIVTLNQTQLKSLMEDAVVKRLPGVLNILTYLEAYWKQPMHRRLTLQSAFTGIRGHKNKFITQAQEHWEQYSIFLNKGGVWYKWLDVPNDVQRQEHKIVNVKNFLFFYMRETGKCWLFDPRNNKWEKLANMPDICTIRYSCLVSCGDHILAMGGVTSNGQSLNTIMQYSFEQNTWHFLCTLPENTSRLEGCFLKNCVYVIGKFSREELWCIDTAKKISWRVCDLPCSLPPDDLTIFVMENRIAVRTIKGIYLYDIDKKRWRENKYNIMQKWEGYSILPCDKKCYTFYSWPLLKNIKDANIPACYFINRKKHNEYYYTILLKCMVRKMGTPSTVVFANSLPKCEIYRTVPEWL